jgi:hypothetical protein
MVKFGILIGALLCLQSESSLVRVLQENCPATHHLTWTSWFDRDNPSGYGDYETLIDLRK